MWTGLLSWVSGKLGFAWGWIPAPYRILIIAVATAVALAAAGYAGWTLRSWKADALEKKLVEEKLEAMQAYQKISRDFVIAWNSKRAPVKIVYETITMEVENVTTGRLCLDPAAVGLWNSALDGVPPASGRTAEETASTGEAGASDKEVVGNAVANFEQYEECRAQLNALIDWHEKVDQ